VINQILTRWEVPNGAADITTVMNFDESVAVASQRAAVAEFWGDISPLINPNVKWTVETSGRILDEATGGLVGTWFDGTVQTGNGTASGSSTLAGATMVLARWRAGIIVNGRRLQGRTYVPGISGGVSADGELAPSSLTVANGAVLGFVQAEVGFSIWHRPKGSTPGSIHPVNDGDVWREFAVQRTRRA
jgi:hypothetical protein